MRRLTQLLGTLLALAVVVAACGAGTTVKERAADGDAPEVEGGGWLDDLDDEDLDDAIEEPIEPSTDADDAEAPTSDEIVAAALADVESFWDRSYEDLYGEPYEPITGGFWAYGPDGEQPPCGEPAPAYEDIAQNAFFCPSADLIAWDNVNLMPELYEDFGGFTLGIVMAHEFGHAVQFRSGTQGDTILTELQADCFAGAWTKDVADGGSEYFELSLADLDQAVAGFLELRDGIGTDALDPAAHGTGFDRIGAFSEGFDQGLERCAEYPDDYASGRLVVVEVPFTDPEDFEREGNLPLADIFDLAVDDLEDFWSVLFNELGGTWTPVASVTPIDPATDEVSCGGETYRGEQLEFASFYCVDDNTVYVDGVGLIPYLYDIGDFAVATELARQYAYAAQVQAGVTDNTLATNLSADCYAGLYASSGFLQNREDQVLSLSPGDLDEAVIAFLESSDSSADAEAGNVSVGTAFQRFDAFRDGFISGVEACDAYLEDG